jgi:predicted DNA-binding transcriptional regulator AlpA
MVTTELEQRALIGLRDLMKLTGIAKQTLERMKTAGRLPPHIEFSKTLHKWRAEDARLWIELGCPGRE